MISETNSFTTGWVTYVRQAACKGALMELDDWERDDWLRRKLRCVRLKQCKRQTGPGCRATIKVRGSVNQDETLPGWMDDVRA